VNYLLNKIPVDKIPSKNCVSPQFFCKEFTTFFALTVSETTALTKGMENWFGCLWEVVVVVVLSVVVFVVPCKGKGNLGAQGWVGTDVVGAEFTVVTESREVTGKGVDEGLLSQNGGQVVDEEN